ncbi:MAG: type II restriction endonuclease, partial [Candidatus Hydrogenedentes bacterium]|nr:type II restriction endonuclease [Candidatus Hydrogenedentota bacterium]
MNAKSSIHEARLALHARLLERVLKTDVHGIPTNADKHSRPSVSIARAILEKICTGSPGDRLAGQKAGAEFEQACEEYLKQTFPLLKHLRPGQWEVQRGDWSTEPAIAQFEQYSHLAD